MRIKQLGRIALQLGISPHDLCLIAVVYLPLGDDYVTWESRLHNHFKTKRVIGEWFNISYDEVFKCLEEWCGNSCKFSIKDIPIYSNTENWDITLPNIIEVSEENYAKYCTQKILNNLGVYDFTSCFDKKLGTSINLIIESYNKYCNKYIDEVLYEVLLESIPEFFNQKVKSEILSSFNNIQLKGLQQFMQ